MKRHHVENKNEYDTLRQAIANLTSLVESELSYETSLREEIARPSKKIVDADHPHHFKLEEKPIQRVKNTFKTILEHLRRLYKNQGGDHLDKSIVEGIQTIMVLVGEAASHLDKYTSLFRKIHGESITNLKEYKDLQDFYSRTIAKISNEALLDLDFSDPDLMGGSSIILEDEQKALTDLEIVKKDTDYELFLLKREDGARFYHNDLLRHIQAATGIRELGGEFAGDDPFVQIKNWEDKRLQSCAEQLIKYVRSSLEVYYQSALKIKDMDLVTMMNKALMALMLASNQKNLLRQFSVKSCSQYFRDFLGFLREALESIDYQKLVEKPPKKAGGFLNALLDLIHGLCLGLFSHIFPSQEGIKGLEKLIERGEPGGHPLLKNHEGELAIAEYMEVDFKGIDKLLKQFPNGPLLKTLDLFLEDQERSFDPLFMGDLPNQLYSIDVDGLYTTLLRIPSPTTQEFIHLAKVTEEFKAFLRAYSHGPVRKHHLLINLQDRTSWKEHARCEALEQLQYQAEFNDCLTVVTLPKETEFYYQMGPYQDLNQSQYFMDQFKEHIMGNQSGFYFPKKIEKILFPGFIDQLISAVHRTFFFQKNVLSRRQRLDFIEIVYLFLECKLVELTHAYSFSLTCKDGIDTGATSSTLLFVFLKLLNGKEISEQEIEHIRFMLFAPALMNRERQVNAERFNRMLNVLKLIENDIHRSSQATFQHTFEQEFGRLYETSILFSPTNLPKLPS